MQTNQVTVEIRNGEIVIEQMNMVMNSNKTIGVLMTNIHLDVEEAEQIIGMLQEAIDILDED
jgi:hypothetical protein